GDGFAGRQPVDEVTAGRCEPQQPDRRAADEDAAVADAADAAIQTDVEPVGERRHQVAAIPASTGNTPPVTPLASSLHSQAMRAATSPGSTSRRSGWCTPNIIGLSRS